MVKVIIHSKDLIAKRNLEISPKQGQNVCLCLDNLEFR